MLDHGNGQLSAVGFFNPGMGQSPAGTFFGGGVGGGFAGAFDISGDKVVNCALVFGRALVECSDTQLGVLGANQTPSGCIYAKVKHDGESGSLELSVHHTESDSLPEDELEASYRLLYKALGSGQDKAWVDFRYTPTLFAMD